MPIEPYTVSVCLPVYNGAAHIAESIESVLAQTYGNFRLIVSDNCSTDDTAAIVRSFGDHRITYVRNARNLGVVGNFNRCLSLADGEYVCIWAYDDVMLPENLERKVRILNENPGVAFVHSNVYQIDRQGQILGEHWAEDSRRDYVEKGQEVIARYLRNMVDFSIVFIGSVLARRTCYERVGGYRCELPLTCDGEMWMRMLLFYDVACIGAPLVKYRIHPAMGTMAYHGPPYLEQHYLAARIILSEHKARLPQRAGLKRRVFMAFADRALKEAIMTALRLDFASAAAYARLAAIISPQILWR
jgi:glycosyltransferase involved in cell wall biosynthesis